MRVQFKDEGAESGQTERRVRLGRRRIDNTRRPVVVRKKKYNNFN
jgi:hypothetical protein